MKTLTILFLFVLALPSYSRILTVSNRPDSPGQYTSMTAAMGAVLLDDTILVHGSPINYGTFLLTHDNLVIIGTGHNPDKQYPYTTSFTDIFIDANNIQLIGITVGSVAFTRNNFTMRRCKVLESPSFSFAVQATTSSSSSDRNLLFESNVFTGTDPNLLLWGTRPGDVVTIRNNVFSAPIIIHTSAQFLNCLITNNIFLKGPQAFLDVDHANISNNIFFGSSPFVPIAATINYYNNISFQCLNNVFTVGTNITASNNLEGVDPQFVNYPGVGAVFSDLHDYNLAAGSPGIATGSDGSDRGVYGGFGTIFNMRGEPTIPIVTGVTITSPTTVAPGGTLTITVTSKRVH